MDDLVKYYKIPENEDSEEYKEYEQHITDFMMHKIKCIDSDSHVAPSIEVVTIDGEEYLKVTNCRFIKTSQL